MVAVLQRVREASVSIQGEAVGKIGPGLVILLGVAKEDTEETVKILVDKIVGFRIFNDESGKMNLSIQEVNRSALVVSQFTLCGDWKKGRRPSFTRAASAEKGQPLYESFIHQLRQHQIPVQTGQFGANMQVSLTNDGPVTFVLDTNPIH